MSVVSLLRDTFTVSQIADKTTLLLFLPLAFAAGFLPHAT